MNDLAWIVKSLTRWPRATGHARLGLGTRWWSVSIPHSGVVAVPVILLGGTTQEQLENATESIRSTIGCARVTVHSSLQYGDRAVVTLYRRAIPEVTPYPLELLEPDGLLPPSAFRPLPLGVNSAGEMVSIPLFDPVVGASSLLVASVPGGGKSALLRTVLTGFAPTVASIFMIDPAGGAEGHLWRGRLSELVDSLEPEPTQRILGNVLELVERRSRLRGLGVSVTDFIPVVLVIDELAQLGGAGDKKSQDLIRATLHRIVALARKSAVAVVGATQRTTSTSIDTATKSLFDWRIAFAHPDDRFGSESILGSGRYEAARLSKSDKGVGYITNGGVPELFRAYWVEPELVEFLCEDIKTYTFRELEAWDKALGREIANKVNEVNANAERPPGSAGGQSGEAGLVHRRRGEDAS